MRDSNLGVEKQSFTLYYNGGEIWAEHLDTIDNQEDMKSKFEKDLQTMARPSTSSFVAINLAQSPVDEAFLSYLSESLLTCGKSFHKIVFVGLTGKMRRYIRKQPICCQVLTHCTEDFEKAKQWLL